MSKETTTTQKVRADALVSLDILATLATGATVQARIIQDDVTLRAVTGLLFRPATADERRAARGLIDELGERIADIDGWHECSCGAPLGIGRRLCDDCQAIECRECGAPIVDDEGPVCDDCVSEGR